MDKKEKNMKKEITQWIAAIVIVIAVAFVLRTFVFCTVRVKGPSMEPLYVHGDIVVAEKLSGIVSGPDRNDIIVCKYSTSDELIIKRVLGLPGDDIDIYYDRDKEEYVLVINGELVEEPYLKEAMMQPGDTEYIYTVPDDCYFVMGDNRNLSSDSRFMSIGAIPRENIAGKVVFKIWPLGN
ncbi:MAG: signal peptidase I [Lachnospiraceae bacterium]|nr:signal peptidase I [Lachnospiraceae bacterium]